MKTIRQELVVKAISPHGVVGFSEVDKTGVEGFIFAKRLVYKGFHCKHMVSRAKIFTRANLIEMDNVVFIA